MDRLLGSQDPSTRAPRWQLSRRAGMGIVLLALAALAGAYLLSVVLQRGTTIAAQEQQISGLLAANQALSTETQQLGEERARLLETREALTGERNSLASERDTLVTAREALSAERDKLSGRVGELEGKASTLSAKAAESDRQATQARQDAARELERAKAGAWYSSALASVVDLDTEIYKEYSLFVTTLYDVIKAMQRRDAAAYDSAYKRSLASVDRLDKLFETRGTLIKEILSAAD